MTDWVATGVVGAYYAVLALLAVYGVHRVRLLWLLSRPESRPISPLPPANRSGSATSKHSSEGCAAVPMPATSGADACPAPRELPLVTVQLPIFNELLVAPRLVEAVARLDYPRHLLEVQILDDSTDETSPILSRQAATLREHGLDVHHLRRTQRRGFKAGALEAGLGRARGALVAIFDADFVPAPDFLLRTVGAFEDPGVGMVQAAWGHLNRHYSMLTEIQAMLLDGHFQVEHAARARGGLFFNFNGTAGVWRRQAIEDAGGWQHDTLTEDLDLSYRAQLAGWRFVYLPDLLVPAELPIEIDAFRSQQHRWTHGAAQTLRKLAARILIAKLPLRIKVEALAHLGAHFGYPLMVALVVLFFPAMTLRYEIGSPRLPLFDFILFCSASLSIITFYLRSQRTWGVGLGRALALQLPLMALGIGMSLHNARAALSGLFRRGGTFVRTPKYCIEPASTPGAPSSSSAARQLGARYSAGIPKRVGELLMFGYLLACLALAVSHQLWWAVPFLALFLSGYGYVLALSYQAPTAPRPAPRRRTTTFGSTAHKMVS